MRIQLLLPTALFASISVLTLAGADWSGFRGTNSSGVADATGLPTTFGPDENVTWKTDLPDGNSSPVFGQDAIFLTGFEGENLYTIALDRSTGRVLWRREVTRDR